MKIFKNRNNLMRLRYLITMKVSKIILGFLEILRLLIKILKIISKIFLIILIKTTLKLIIIKLKIFTNQKAHKIVFKSIHFFKIIIKQITF